MGHTAFPFHRYLSSDPVRTQNYDFLKIDSFRRVPFQWIGETGAQWATAECEPYYISEWFVVHK